MICPIMAKVTINKRTLNACNSFSCYHEQRLLFVSFIVMKECL
ncbi:hypothetical protein [Moraxella lacunata]